MHIVLDLQTNKARFELKVVLLHLWRVHVQTIGGFTSIPLIDFFTVKIADNLEDRSSILKTVRLANFYDIFFPIPSSIFRKFFTWYLSAKVHGGIR
jgi:hypothetical protein